MYSKQILLYYFRRVLMGLCIYYVITDINVVYVIGDRPLHVVCTSWYMYQSQ